MVKGTSTNFVRRYINFYLAGAVILGGELVYLAIRLWREQSKKWARTLFWYSNMYLAALFAIMVLDRVIH